MDGLVDRYKPKFAAAARSQIADIAKKPAAPVLIADRGRIQTDAMMAILCKYESSAISSDRF